MFNENLIARVAKLHTKFWSSIPWPFFKRFK